MTVNFITLKKCYWLYISKGYHISINRNIPNSIASQMLTIQNQTFINIEGANNNLNGIQHQEI